MLCDVGNAVGAPHEVPLNVVDPLQRQSPIARAGVFPKALGKLSVVPLVQPTCPILVAHASQLTVSNTPTERSHWVMPLHLAVEGAP